MSLFIFPSWFHISLCHYSKNLTAQQQSLPMSCAANFIRLFFSVSSLKNCEASSRRRSKTKCRCTWGSRQWRIFLSFNEKQLKTKKGRKRKNFIRWFRESLSSIYHFSLDCIFFCLLFVVWLWERSETLRATELSFNSTCRNWSGDLLNWRGRFIVGLGFAVMGLWVDLTMATWKCWWSFKGEKSSVKSRK